MEDAIDETRVKLRDIIGVGQRMTYTYDFGDDWQHRIEVKRRHTVDERSQVPCCLAGARACPPEDCGGIPGYQHLLDVMSDPRHPERRTIEDWLGGPFDADALDIAAINDQLERLGSRRR